MALGLNLISPITLGSPSSSADQSNETSDETSGATSGTSASTAADSSSGASKSSEAQPSQTVQPLSTDIAIVNTGKTGIGRSFETTDLTDVATRQFAVRARAESIVEALIDAISAPIEASELAAVEAAEAELKAGIAQQSAVKQQADRIEGGLSAVRDDS